MSVCDHKHALLTTGSRLVVGDEHCFPSTVEQVSLTYFLFGCISCKALVKSVLKKKKKKNAVMSIIIRHNTTTVSYGTSNTR